MKFSLEKDGESVGTVLVDTSGEDVVITASCEETLDGIWRAYLIDGQRI